MTPEVAACAKAYVARLAARLKQPAPGYWLVNWDPAVYQVIVARTDDGTELTAAEFIEAAIELLWEQTTAAVQATQGRTHGDIVADLGLRVANLFV